jgi:hypothetical protein
MRTGAVWPGDYGGGAIVLRGSGQGGKWVVTDMGQKLEGSPVTRGSVVPVGLGQEHGEWSVHCLTRGRILCDQCG